MGNNKNSTYKEADAGAKELFSMLIYRPIARFLLMAFFKNAKVTPNQITLVSLFFSAVTAFLFVSSQYPLRLLGVFFLHLTYIFDMLDGQYARHKGLSSKYGKWFDPFIDTIKLIFLFIALAYSAYAGGSRPLAFIPAMIAMSNSFLAYYVLNTRGHIVKGANFEVRLRQNVYVGYEIALYWIISVFVVLDKIYLGLLFLATIGALAWLKLFMSLRRYYFKHRQEVEG